jgi:hypothetical protein
LIASASAAELGRKAPRMEPIEYEIELKRINGPSDHTSANLPSLTKGQRLKVPVDGGLVYAEVIEVSPNAI